MYRAIAQRTGIQTDGNGAQGFPGFRVEYRQADLDFPAQCGFAEFQLVDVPRTLALAMCIQPLRFLTLPVIPCRP
jgi:hypothetical protein